ncbi:hypothetical protein IFM61392_01878 [Aspergillus lentulus]|uniref:Uncharacterized protein n=1 Tax=Aspergillus lentulus TaxID=293939 RepID=A0ABQ0ZUX7_ASPLE|nr:hypothetical protein IFM60648_01628 [Aspergillus lentulus]GFG01611.1 hypothetical protein IFM61392_01878 [Aspergillus lentulus]
MIGKLEAYHYIPRLVEDILHKDTRSWSGNRSVYVPQSKPISNLSWAMQMVAAFQLVASSWTYARSLKDASGTGPTDDDSARTVLLGTGTNDVTGELETLLPAAHYSRKLKTTSHYKVQFRHLTKNYERKDLYPMRQTDDNDEYGNTGFLYGSKRDSSNLLVAFVDANNLRAKDDSSTPAKGPDVTTAALITAEAINRQFMVSPVRAAFMQILNTLDSKRRAELNRQLDAAIEAAFNPAPNRSVELDDGAFVAVNLFDQKGTHLGWLGPNGQVVKSKTMGHSVFFSSKYARNPRRS